MGLASVFIVYLSGKSSAAGENTVLGIQGQRLSACSDCNCSVRPCRSRAIDVVASLLIDFWVNHPVDQSTPVVLAPLVVFMRQLAPQLVAPTLISLPFTFCLTEWLLCAKSNVIY